MKENPMTKQTPRRIVGSDRLQWRKSKSGRSLHLNGTGPALCRLVPDEPTGLWRIEHDGRLSDIVNISRASDAALSLALASQNHTEDTPTQPRGCVISDGVAL